MSEESSNGGYANVNTDENVANDASPAKKEDDASVVGESRGKDISSDTDKENSTKNDETNFNKDLKNDGGEKDKAGVDKIEADGEEFNDKEGVMSGDTSSEMEQTAGSKVEAVKHADENVTASEEDNAQKKSNVETDEKFAVESKDDDTSAIPVKNDNAGALSENDKGNENNSPEASVQSTKQKSTKDADDGGTEPEQIESGVGLNEEESPGEEAGEGADDGEEEVVGEDGDSDAPLEGKVDSNEKEDEENVAVSEEDKVEKEKENESAVANAENDEDTNIKEETKIPHRSPRKALDTEKVYGEKKLTKGEIDATVERLSKNKVSNDKQAANKPKHGKQCSQEEVDKIVERLYTVNRERKLPAKDNNNAKDTIRFNQQEIDSLTERLATVKQAKQPKEPDRVTEVEVKHFKSLSSPDKSAKIEELVKRLSDGNKNSRPPDSSRGITHAYKEKGIMGSYAAQKQ